MEENLNSKMIRKSAKGITLIALVITIIVLLILAAISISMLTGDNNIIKNAEKSRNIIDGNGLKEEIQLIVLGKQIDSSAKTGNNKSIKQYIEEEIKDAIIEEIDGYTDVYYVKKNGQYVTVYENDTIEEGKIEIWDGTKISSPEFKKNGEIWDWYIYNAAQLKFLADFMNNGNGKDIPESLKEYTEEKYYNVTMTTSTTINLMNNIDLGAREGNADNSLTNLIEKEASRWRSNPEKLKWTPIGNDATKVQNNLGTFNGNNHFIKGMYVNREESNNGLFGNSNTIHDLTIKDSCIQGTSDTAGIVGDSYGNIENCHNKNTAVILLDEQYLNSGAGIVAYVTGINNIKNCSNSGSVLCENGTYIGGIVGYISENVEIYECQNSGEINGKRNVGGIIGFNNGKRIMNCNNNGYVYGKAAIGGIIGTSRTSHDIINCNNKGIVTGITNIGGIIGDVYNGSEVLNCNNYNMVRADNGYIGGIVGYIKNGKIKECENVGKIEGDIYTGGIVGFINGNITNCKNNGNVNGGIGNGNVSTRTGGVVGYISSGDISLCINNGEVNSSRNRVGGVIGDTNARVTKCVNNGKVSSEGNYLGGVCGHITTDTNIASNTISFCYNTGTVDSRKNVHDSRPGGVVGRITRNRRWRNDKLL